MLVDATSAYGYYEGWDGWFNSGFLTFLEGDPFDYVEGEGRLEDLTSGDVDTFFVSTITPSTFTCATSGWTIKLWPGASGSKPTGQEGQKEAYNGAWSGYAILTITGFPPDTFTVVGTWASTDPYHFNYDSEPDPTYTAWWRVSNSDPEGIEGEGGSAGERIHYSP
ncbi:hypothetical protein CEE36_00590 [candidate division TA06 bacterium B3_TA06]|uniref:Uncharacterized protein n=1 Tax=candidate division TA06 bacterium B3_TA06 TaxID=2012487 RepID=A0A532VAV6_UNCT6|nr:MAG: hypothetical protein CEE36_00590 [candidate division TA06 bacterium B3_TA06]